MALLLLKFTLVSLFLFITFFSSRAADGGYTLNTRAREHIDNQVFTVSKDTLKWTAEEHKGVSNSYSNFPAYRGIFEGYGMEYSLSQFDRFKLNSISADDLNVHLSVSDSPRIIADKPTIVGVIQRGGNSHNVVMALFFRWLKGEQVVLWRCRRFTDEEAQRFKSKKSNNSDVVETQIESLLTLMQSRGVPVYEQISDKDGILPDVNLELTVFMKFRKVIGVVDGMTGQGVDNTEIYQKVRVGLDLVRRVIGLGAAQWEADVLTFYKSSIYDEAKGQMSDTKHRALCADKLRVPANPDGTTAILGFMGHEASVPGVYHLVVPAPIEEFLAPLSPSEICPQNKNLNRSQMIELRTDAPENLNYKKMVVNIASAEAITLLENTQLFENFDNLRKLAGLLKVTET